MPSSRARILVPVLLLLLAVAVAAGLIVGSGGDTSDEAENRPTAQDSESTADGEPGTAGDAPAGDRPTGPDAGTDTGEDAEAPAAPDLTRRLEGDPMAAGPVDAPVGVVVFSDYGCPYCQQWAHEAQPTVLDYAADGAVRLEWRDIAILGDDSTRAAVAAAAAAQQGAYQEFHDALFADMQARSDADLIELAEQIGLDVEQFTADLTDPAVVSTVRGNMQEAQSLGLQSTPSFVVAGTPVVGAQPAEVFVEIIEAALAEAQ